MLINIVYFWELWNWIDWLIDLSKYNYVILFIYLYFRHFLHFFEVDGFEARRWFSGLKWYLYFIYVLSQWQKILNKTFDVFKSAQIWLTESLSTMYCCSKYLLHSVFSELDHTVIIYHSKHF